MIFLKFILNFALTTITRTVTVIYWFYLPLETTTPTKDIKKYYIELSELVLRILKDKILYYYTFMIVN